MRTALSPAMATVVIVVVVVVPLLRAEPGEDCDSCANDCDSFRRGKPTGRYCCGNGILEGPEEDGRCHGNF